MSAHGSKKTPSFPNPHSEGTDGGSFISNGTADYGERLLMVRAEGDEHQYVQLQSALTRPQAQAFAMMAKLKPSARVWT